MPRRTQTTILAFLIVSAVGLASLMAPDDAMAARTDDSASIKQDIEAVLSQRDFQRTWPETPESGSARDRRQDSVPKSAENGYEATLESGNRILQIFEALKFVAWILAGLVVLYVAYRIIRAIRSRRGIAAPDIPATSSTDRQPQSRQWSPLDDIEALARDGRLEEAVHLLLLRFIEDVRERTKTTLQPALTSREVMAITPLPEAAQAYFSLLVAAVERTHFGGRPIDRAAFDRCLEGYRAFAAGPAVTT